MRLLDTRRGKLVSVRSDGTLMAKWIWGRWKMYGRVRQSLMRDGQVDEEALRQFVAEHHERWLEGDYHLPSLAELERWEQDGVAEAVDGCPVEPDGRCPHGMPSWLLVVGVV
jgi:hypothetical protein